jgi:Acetoacetate decarboxylase (ADC)
MTMRLGVAALLVCLAGLGPAAGAAHAQAGSGVAVDIRSISAIAPLRSDHRAHALDVYEQLIPNGLDTPRDPAVGVWLAELSTLRSAPGRPMDDAGHWIEGAIDIRVKHGGEEGWYPIHYPVTAEFWFQAGRYVGLPKRHAAAAITPAGRGWTAQATPRGTGGPSMVMDWRPASGDRAALERAFRVPIDPMFPLNTALRGPDLMRVQYSIAPPGPFQTAIPGGAPPYSAASKPDAGTIHLRLRGDIDGAQEGDLPRIFPKGTELSDLISTDQTVPGTHAFYAVTLGSDSKTIGRGGYPRARRGHPRARRRKCRRRGFATVRVRGLRKSRIRTLRARAGRRRVPARLLRHGRVRLDLRPLRRSRYRVRIVAVTRSGKQRVYRRTARRRCARRR